MATFGRWKFGIPFDAPKEWAIPEPGTSGLEKTAPPGELEFSS